MTIDLKDMNQRLIRLAQSPNSRFWRPDYEALSPAEQIFRTIWEFEAEVNNGGFHQYFSNSSGRLALFAAGALRAIGATKMPRIVEQAIEVVGHDIPWSDDGVRQELVAALDLGAIARLDELDRAFVAYQDNLTALLYNYVREHRNEMNVRTDCKSGSFSNCVGAHRNT